MRERERERERERGVLCYTLSSGFVLYMEKRRMVYSLYIYKRRMAGYSTVFKQLLNQQVAARTVTVG